VTAGAPLAATPCPLLTLLHRRLCCNVRFVLPFSTTCAPSTPATGVLPATGRAKELLRERIAFLYVDGHPTSPEIRPSTLLRHPQAEWVLRLVGSFSTTLVPPGDQWLAEVRTAGPERPLRVVPVEHLTSEDGVRPEILERWSVLRS
jgi:hypothetical protein